VTRFLVCTCSKHCRSYKKNWSLALGLSHFSSCSMCESCCSSSNRLHMFLLKEISPAHKLDSNEAYKILLRFIHTVISYARCMYIHKMWQLESTICGFSGWGLPSVGGVCHQICILLRKQVCMYILYRSMNRFWSSIPLTEMLKVFTLFWNVLQTITHSLHSLLCIKKTNFSLSTCYCGYGIIGGYSFKCHH